MNDQNVTAALTQFAADRDWHQFHSPANLAKSVNIEAGELLECFQWSEETFDREEVKFELADVLTYAYFMAHSLDLDPGEIILEKLKITAEKYPVTKSYGTPEKYDQL